MRSFDTARRTRDVAAWLRHATEIACKDHWPDWLAFVHGHQDDKTPLRGEQADHRFSFLPLPTVNSKLHRIESIRRVLVAAPADCRDRIEFIRRRLPGQKLTFGGNVVGLLNLVPSADWVLKQSTRSARRWSLPRHDVEDPLEIDRLLHRAVAQAGIDAEIEDLEWGDFGFLAGVEPARRFAKSLSMTGRRLHLHLTFRQPVPGPLAIGAGRYRGFGTFAADDEPS